MLRESLKQAVTALEDAYDWVHMDMPSLSYWQLDDMKRLSEAIRLAQRVAEDNKIVL